jgi:hypothetical protein
VVHPNFRPGSFNVSPREPQCQARETQTSVTETQKPVTETRTSVWGDSNVSHGDSNVSLASLNFRSPEPETPPYAIRLYPARSECFSYVIGAVDFTRAPRHQHLQNGAAVHEALKVDPGTGPFAARFLVQKLRRGEVLDREPK